MSALLSSSPASPSRITREIGGLFISLSENGLSVSRTSPGDGPPVKLTPSEALALSDFLRGPGARTLISRAWLAEQHAEALESADSE
jgi:hypothetical protein